MIGDMNAATINSDEVFEIMKIVMMLKDNIVEEIEERC